MNHEQFRSKENLVNIWYHCSDPLHLKHGIRVNCNGYFFLIARRPINAFGLVFSIFFLMIMTKRNKYMYGHFIGLFEVVLCFVNTNFFCNDHILLLTPRELFKRELRGIKIFFCHLH